jgi:hypothetical protein
MMQAWADCLDGLRSVPDELTSTPSSLRFASAHLVAEQTGVKTPQLSGPEINATP